MADKLTLKPVEMTEAIMQDLENRGLIIRLCPNHHELLVQQGQTLGKDVYQSAAAHGAHKLLAVTVNRSTFAAFGSHPGNEEFLFIGDPETKPMFLAICLHRKDDLDSRIANNQLKAADFVCLQVKYNDPTVSFFTMLADVPHGEAVCDIDGRPASFYVTEPSNMGIELTDFGNYELSVPQN